MSKVYSFKLILLSRSHLDTVFHLLLPPCNAIDIWESVWFDSLHSTG